MSKSNRVSLLPVHGGGQSRRVFLWISVKSDFKTHFLRVRVPTGGTPTRKVSIWIHSPFGFNFARLFVNSPWLNRHFKNTFSTNAGTYKGHPRVLGNIYACLSGDKFTEQNASLSSYNFLILSNKIIKTITLFCFKTCIINLPDDFFLGGIAVLGTGLWDYIFF